MLERAREANRALAGLSDRQHRKINEAMEKDIDRAANSDSFRAMERDVMMFGQAAFRPEVTED